MHHSYEHPKIVAVLQALSIFILNVFLDTKQYVMEIFIGNIKSSQGPPPPEFEKNTDVNLRKNERDFLIKKIEFLSTLSHINLLLYDFYPPNRVPKVPYGVQSSLCVYPYLCMSCHPHRF